jgi:ATP-dependent DNA ligase
MRYVYVSKPNLISASSAWFKKLDNDPEWAAEIKKNGWRSLSYMRDEKVILQTRHDTFINNPLSVLRNGLRETCPPGTMFDGEILNHLSAASPGRLYLFDIIWFRFKLVTGPLSERRQMLEEIVKPIPGVIEIAPQYFKKKVALFHSLKEAEDEGIVIKKLSSRTMVSLTSCQQNPLWVKVRRPKK